MTPEQQEELQELLGFGRISDMKHRDKKIIENWLFMYQDMPEELLAIIEKLQNWYWGKTGNIAMPVGKMDKSIKEHWYRLCNQEVNSVEVVNNLVSKWRA